MSLLHTHCIVLKPVSMQIGKRDFSSFVSPPPWQLCDTQFECGKFMVCFSIGMNGKTDHTLQTGDLPSCSMQSVMYCVTFPFLQTCTLTLSFLQMLYCVTFSQTCTLTLSFLQTCTLTFFFTPFLLADTVWHVL